MTETAQKSFILYSEYSELIKELPDKEAGILFKAIFDYNLTGEVPSLEGMSKIVFITIRQALDRNAVKYEEKCEKMRQNGLKGGRPRKKQDYEEPPIFLPENQKVFSKSKKSLNDNDHVNVNDHDHVNDNENDNNLSFSPKDLEREERELLETYVRKKKLATKNVTAYVNKIIENGDHIKILEKLDKTKSKKNSEERIQEELSSICDKRSAARVLSKYYATGGSPPAEFDEIMKEYDLDTYDKIEAYGRELYNEKLQGGSK